MFLNSCFIFHPDFHPQSLVLSEVSQSLSVGVGGVILTVLVFPGLNKSSEDTALLSIGSQISPPTPLTGPGMVTQPEQLGGRAVQTRYLRLSSSWCCCLLVLGRSREHLDDYFFWKVFITSHYVSCHYFSNVISELWIRNQDLYSLIEKNSHLAIMRNIIQEIFM